MFILLRWRLWPSLKRWFQRRPSQEKQKKNDLYPATAIARAVAIVGSDDHHKKRWLSPAMAPTMAIAGSHPTRSRSRPAMAISRDGHR
ncbi:hypothetical protein ACOSQ2_025535 [Xanthoceras sorbifolium]